MDRCKWRKMIKEARWSGWVWVGECSFWYRPTRVVPDQRPLNGRCCYQAGHCKGPLKRTDVGLVVFVFTGSLCSLVFFVTQLHWWLPIAVSMWGLHPRTWSWSSAAETRAQSPASSGQPQRLWPSSARDRLSHCRPVLAPASSTGGQCRQWLAVL